MMFGTSKSRVAPKLRSTRPIVAPVSQATKNSAATVISDGRRLVLCPSKVYTPVKEEALRFADQGKSSSRFTTASMNRPQSTSPSLSSTLPFPESRGNESFQNKGDSLLKPLQVLLRLRKSQQKRASHVTTSKQRMISTSEPEFEFTRDMFSSSNTPALIHVTRLIFEIIDPEETGVRFRDCWPIHDKKQESMYRRVAFSWVLEICKDYPQFFQSQPLFPMFVTPCGDRFVRFLMSLLDCVMYIVASGIRERKGKSLVEKPQRSESIGATRSQICILSSTSQGLVQSNKDIQKRILQHVMSQDEIQKNMEDKLKREQGLAQDHLRKVANLIRLNPEMFPTNAQKLLNSSGREQLVADTLKVTDGVQISITAIEDPLAAILNQSWKERLESMDANFRRIIDFYESQKKLIRIIKAFQANYNIVLDGKDIPGLYENNLSSDSTTDVTLIDFLSTGLEKVDSFKQQILGIQSKVFRDPNGQVSLPRQVEQTESLTRQVHELMISLEMDDEKIKDRKFQLRTMAIGLEEVDWNELIPVGDWGLQNVLAMTPVKKFDFNKETGLTPAMIEFMASPENESSSSAETSFLEPNPFEATPGLPHSRTQAKRSLLQKTLQSRLQPPAMSTDGNGRSSTAKQLSKAFESPIASTNSTRFTGRPTPSASEFRNRKTHDELPNLNFGPIFESEEEKRSSPNPPTFKAQPFVISSPQRLEGEITVTEVSDSLARRKSLEHTARIRKAIRASESPTISLTSTKDMSSIIEEAWEQFENIHLRDEESDEEATGIEDVSMIKLDLSLDLDLEDQDGVSD